MFTVLFIIKVCGVEECAYFQNEVDVGGEGLNSVETGDESDGQEALLVHFPPQEKVSLQVVQAEVVFATGGGEVRKHTISTIQHVPSNQSLPRVLSLHLTEEGVRSGQGT